MGISGTFWLLYYMISNLILDSCELRSRSDKVFGLVSVFHRIIKNPLALGGDSCTKISSKTMDVTLLGLRS